jgi:GntR family transcriptional regulator
MSRRYLVGDMLPSEDELMRRFKVSRTTLRHALSELARTGLVEKRHGVGTFIAHQGDTEHVRASISDMVIHTEEIGRSTKVQVVEVVYQRAPSHVQEIFGSSDTALFQQAVRIRRLNSGKPIICVRSFIPERLGRMIDAKAMVRKSLYDLLAEARTPVVSATQDITAVLAQPGIAMLLEIAVGDPLLEMDRILRAQDNEPVCYVEILANPMFFKIHMELAGTAGSPRGVSR